MLKPRILISCLLVPVIVFASGCARPRRVIEVQRAYARPETGYWLYVMTNSPPLRFDSVQALTSSLRKNANGKHDGTVGHAWIRLVGPSYQIECGHTGQYGYQKMGYQDGVLKRIKTHHPDPIGYLWEDLEDGKLQHGSGGFEPSLAVARSISKEEYDCILDYIESYRYPRYTLTDNQCTTLVTGVLSCAGFEMDATARIPIDKFQNVLGVRVQLWTDPKYSEISIQLPQILEEELAKAVAIGEFLDVTP